ncbi:FmdB family zinc ribbon protein [Desulfofundulus thermosubterraneus]|uniref:FmdB family zinc ribbon protein n=1 Tax=Desulfofundulus thermosubterraneus TaxID=348840 RepID=UPI000934B4E9
MPVYDFKCQDCGHIWEVNISGGSGYPESCPNCQSNSLTRLFPAPYVMKGSSRPAGTTCCGRTERCSAPPCSSGNSCRRS